MARSMKSSKKPVSNGRSELAQLKKELKQKDAIIKKANRLALEMGQLIDELSRDFQENREKHREIIEALVKMNTVHMELATTKNDLIAVLEKRNSLLDRSVKTQEEVIDQLVKTQSEVIDQLKRQRAEMEKEN